MSLVDALVALERPLLVALDVDGTLAPIVHDPSAAAIPESTLRALERLARARSATLALITGRDLASLSMMERLEGIWRGVEHGAVVLGPGETQGARILSDSHREALKRFGAWADSHASGAFIEHKPEAIAVHVRVLAERAPEEASALLDEAESCARSLGLHVRKGRCVREAEAMRHDKGEALREIFERTGARSVFFAGDDITDLPAIDFAAAHGVGAFVCSSERPEPPGQGTVTIAGIDAMAALLEDLSRRLD